MNRFLLVVCFLFISATTFGQQFSQYNTGTLFDSFENPAQTTFVPDTSRFVAFNFFIPNFSSSVYLTGNGQVPLKTRAFTKANVSTNLTIGQNMFSKADADVNTYLIMLRIFKSVDGDQEIGFSWQTRAEGKGLFTDETLSLLSGTAGFETDRPYNNNFNSNFRYQGYHQISFAYRERMSKTFSFGFKASALLGIQYQRLNINSSSLTINNDNTADLSLAGNYRISYTAAKFSKQDFLPGPALRNPGASISIGTRLQTRDNFILQGNIKDLGFIHWSGRSTESIYDRTEQIPNVNGTKLEDRLYVTAYNIIRSADRKTGFTTPTNAKLELSANKSYWLDNEMSIKYSPTLILQKELFYDGYAAALSNPIQYKRFTGTLVAAYNTDKVLSAGLQLMVKTENVEFFVGSERLMQTVSFTRAATKKNDAAINSTGSYSGANLFMGFSFKFGQVIEHPLNASLIPIGERPGLIKRLWNKVWGKDDGD